MRHTLSILVENKFGVLARMSGMFSGRGFNIDTLNVAPFLHFIDCHYQAPVGGTKQRNGPAFYT